MGVPLTVAVAALGGLLMLTVSQVLLSWQMDDDIQLTGVARHPLVPIFLAVNLEDGHAVYVNEHDLGYAARSAAGEHGAERPSRGGPNEADTVTLHQPDEHIARSVPRAGISLDPQRVARALKDGKDWSRIHSRHKKALLELPSGETAIWIQVDRIRTRFSSYWNGLLYVVRDGEPVVLKTLIGALDFIIKDVDGDGVQDIIRVTDPSFVRHGAPHQKWLEKISWDAYGWDEAQQAVVKKRLDSDPVIWAYTGETLTNFFLLASPFLLVLLLGLVINIRWMRPLLGFYFYTINLLLVLAVTMHSQAGITWAVLLLLFQGGLRAMASRLPALGTAQAQAA